MTDLLVARNARNAQFCRNPNVVGTAIGRYLIRRGEEDVKVGQHVDIAQIHKIRDESAPRTLWNSDIQDTSWPCVLVFVAQWRSNADLSPQQYIDPFIVLETDDPPRVIIAPVCVVEAKRVFEASRGLRTQDLPPSPIGGGYPIFAEVQGRRHVGTIACIVTDGREHHALTNRHVAGPPGAEIYGPDTFRSSRLGVTATSIGRLPFNEVWPRLPRTLSTSPIDIALIRLDDADDVTAKIYREPVVRKRDTRTTSLSHGAVLGPIVDITELALNLDWIGRQLTAYGAVSGTMNGRIFGYLYRYVDQGGTDYTTDLLIAPLEKEAVMTHPGDSGTLWTYQDHLGRVRPFAVQWGGEHLGGGSAGTRSFALASFLSNATRALEVRVETDLNAEAAEYWGKTGHYIIGELAVQFVQNPDLRKLFEKNLHILTNDVDPPKGARVPAGWQGLADVPDLVWRNTRMATEGPNHYIDLDLEGYDKLKGVSVDQLLSKDHYDPKTIQDLYDDANEDPNRPPDSHNPGALKNFDGMLLWRVGQLFNTMVEAVRSGDLDSFVVAAGTLAHYVGDACQPLHGAKWTNGEPGQEPGAHKAYEDNMLDDVTEFDSSLRKYVQTHLSAAPKRDNVKTGIEALASVHELMHRTQQLIHPYDITKAHQKLVDEQRNAGQDRLSRVKIAQSLWEEFGARTLTVMCDGCNTLAGLWDAAWATAVEADGAAPPPLSDAHSNPIALKMADIQRLYEDARVCASLKLPQMIEDPVIWR